MKEDNYFFKLSRYGDRLLEWYEAHPDAVQPESRRNEVLGFIRQGLLDFSVSRTSLKWGIPIPWDDRHVTYVWFDALANYITAIGYGDDEARFKTWWPGHHLIGKDILRFHCVYWPAMLLSAGLEPPETIHVHGWLLIGGEKMSKTKLNQITPADLVADFGVDGYRYHFLADVPFGPDNDFSYEGMVARYNADLANNLGNLFSRVATVVGEAVRTASVPRPAARQPARDGRRARRYAATAVAAWERVQPSEALEATWRLIRAMNAELEATEPWKAAARPRGRRRARRRARGAAHRRGAREPRAASCVRGDLATHRALGIGARPAAAHRRQSWGGYPGGLAVEKGTPLFPRLTVLFDRDLDRQPLPSRRRAVGGRRGRGDCCGASGGRRSHDHDRHRRDA